MTKVLSLSGLDINQKNFQQILISGDGKENFNKTINEELSLTPPSKNLEILIKKIVSFQNVLLISGIYCI